MTQYTSWCAASRPWPKPTLSTSLIPTVRSIPNPDICAWFPQTRVYAVLLMMAVQNPGISAMYKPNPGISAISEVKPGYIRNLPYELFRYSKTNRQAPLRNPDPGLAPSAVCATRKQTQTSRSPAGPGSVVNAAGPEGASQGAGVLGSWPLPLHVEPH